MPANALRRKVFNLVQSQAFDYFILGAILVNSCFLALTWTDEPASWTAFLEYLNLAFVILFAAEMVLKLIALGPQYTRSNWNRFDGTLVILSLVGLVAAGSLGPIATLLRIFRVARVIRLLRHYRGLMTLINTLVTSLPALGNVMLLFMLLLFIASCLGMNLFSSIKPAGKAFMFGDPVEDALVHRRADFADFPRSFDSLFRCVKTPAFLLTIVELPAVRARSRRAAPS